MAIGRTARDAITDNGCALVMPLFGLDHRQSSSDCQTRFRIWLHPRTGRLAWRCTEVAGAPAFALLAREGAGATLMPTKRDAGGCHPRKKRAL